MIIGYRFRLMHDVDRFPDFIAPAGRTGTVTVISDDLWAKMDLPIAGAEEWDNELYWDSIEEFQAETQACT